MGGWEHLGRECQGSQWVQNHRDLTQVSVPLLMCCVTSGKGLCLSTHQSPGLKSEGK